MAVACGSSVSGEVGSTDSGADSDSDSDSDSDTDTGTEEVCDPPSGITDWGQACEQGVDECPPDTECISINGLSNEWGFCTPFCCAGDNSYCTDIGSGVESCSVSNDNTGERWCVVICTSNEDCLGGTTCQEVPDSTSSICYGGPDTDTDTDTSTDTDTDTGTDTDTATS
jgi:clumping factor A